MTAKVNCQTCATATCGRRFSHLSVGLKVREVIPLELATGPPRLNLLALPKRTGGLALRITSALRFSPLGPLGIGPFRVGASA